MSKHTIYYEKLAAAFVRGKLLHHPVRETHPALFATILEEVHDKGKSRFTSCSLLPTTNSLSLSPANL